MDLNNPSPDRTTDVNTSALGKESRVHDECYEGLSVQKRREVCMICTIRHTQAVWKQVVRRQWVSAPLGIFR